MAMSHNTSFTTISFYKQEASSKESIPDTGYAFFLLPRELLWRLVHRDEPEPYSKSGKKQSKKNRNE
jgi:hypothetical protein